jgi:hypothetical protein
MPDNKTQPTEKKVEDFLNTIQPDQKQEDCKRLDQLMREVSGKSPVMWGNMVGYGQYHYKYETGREGDMFLIGFAPRARNISIYGAAYNEALDKMKEELGKVKLGKSCMYVNKLADIDEEKLKEILHDSIKITLKRYPQEN